MIIWDNFYANDYCPRRLFLGPWRAVNLPDVMLNPTGMIETDLLLLDLMSLFKKLTFVISIICQYFIMWIKLQITITQLQVLDYFDDPTRKFTMQHSFRRILRSSSNDELYSCYREQGTGRSAQRDPFCIISCTWNQNEHRIGAIEKSCTIDVIDGIRSLQSAFRNQPNTTDKTLKREARANATNLNDS